MHNWVDITGVDFSWMSNFTSLNEGLKKCQGEERVFIYITNSNITWNNESSLEMWYNTMVSFITMAVDLLHNHYIMKVHKHVYFTLNGAKIYL